MKPEVLDGVLELLAKQAKRAGETDAQAIARTVETPKGKKLYEERKELERQAPRKTSDGSILASGALIAGRTGLTKAEGIAAYLETPQGIAAYERYRS